MKAFLSSKRQLITEIIQANKDTIVRYKNEKQEQDKDIRHKDFQIYSYLNALDGSEEYKELIKDINCFLHHINRMDMEESRGKNLKTSKQIKKRQKELDGRLAEAEKRKEDVQEVIDKSHKRIKRNRNTIAKFVEEFKLFDQNKFEVKKEDLPKTFDEHIEIAKSDFEACDHKLKVTKLKNLTLHRSEISNSSM